MNQTRLSVLVLYNYIGHDEYENLSKIDPGSLDFTPEYPIHVATVKEEYDAIVKALCSEGFAARAVNLEDRLTRLEHLIWRERPDIVFNLVESFHGEQALEAAVAGYLELHRIPFTGASSFALGVCMRKALTKELLLQHRIPTPRFRLLSTPTIPHRHGLRYPLIVKPSRQDGSLGVSKDSVAQDRGQLKACVARVLEDFRPPVLVEEFVQGTELHVSVWGNRPQEVLPIIEFDFSKLPSDHPPVVTYDVKWNPLSRCYHKVHTRCPALLDRALEEKVRSLALRSYVETGCRDYARVDMRLSAEGKPYVLEVNPNPDLTAGVSFMEATEKAGISFSQTIRRIAEMAWERRI